MSLRLNDYELSLNRKLYICKRSTAKVKRLLEPYKQHKVIQEAILLIEQMEKDIVLVDVKEEDRL